MPSTTLMTPSHQMLRLTIILFLCATAVFAQGDDNQQEPKAPSQDIAAKFERLDELEKQLEELNEQPEPSLEILRERREAEARTLLSEIDRVEAEIQVALVGFEDSSYTSIFEQTPVDLETELRDFFQPLMDLFRSATAQSREIEELRREITGLNEQKTMAESALASLAKPQETTEERQFLLASKTRSLKTMWTKRLAATESRTSTLQARLDQLQEEADNAETDVSGPVAFLRERGTNLFLGVLAAMATWIILTLIGTLFRRLSQNRAAANTSKAAARLGSSNLGVPVRALRLSYYIFSIIAAVLAALAVFNARNDWILLGFGTLLLLGLVWTLIKSLPEAVSQIRTLLNLGSVQEGERLTFDGIPWLVSKLDFHTVLENPSLEGGNLSLPVGQLSGLHSRPTAPSESWFPTKPGDWVLMEDEKIAQVMVQTPGYVTLRRLGGATVMIPSASFVESPLTNLSRGFRVELEFGLDYALQSQATTSVLQTMRTYLQKHLPGCLPENSLKNLEVEFYAAADSSLNYEIEVDLDGSAACEYEEVGRTLSRLLVDCCNENGWGIPFPQMTVHGMS